MDRPYKLKEEHQHDFPNELPVPMLKARQTSPWVAVLVEPLPQRSDILEFVESDYDENTSLGIGWVLSAAQEYYHVPPKLQGKSKIPKSEEMTHRYKIEVKRGDRVCFRRFLRSQALVQAPVLRPEDEARFPDYAAVFLYVTDIIGFVEDDGDSTNSGTIRRIGG